MGHTVYTVDQQLFIFSHQDCQYIDSEKNKNNFLNQRDTKICLTVDSFNYTWSSLYSYYGFFYYINYLILLLSKHSSCPEGVRFWLTSIVGVLLYLSKFALRYKTFYVRGSTRILTFYLGILVGENHCSLTLSCGSLMCFFINRK